MHSKDGLEMEVVTISSYKGMLKSLEPRFNPLLFPDKKKQRPKKFNPDKKQYVFITARVHPGETPGTYVFNGVMK